MKFSTNNNNRTNSQTAHERFCVFIVKRWNENRLTMLSAKSLRKLCVEHIRHPVRPHAVQFKAFVNMVLHHTSDTHQFNGIDGAHSLPNSFFFVMFFDQLGKCCCFVLDWVSFDCYCYTSFNLAFILRESRVARFVCFSISSFSFRFFSGFSTHFAHAMLRTPRCAAVKVNVCIESCRTGWYSLHCGFAPARWFGLLPSCALWSTFKHLHPTFFYPSILGRFVIKHFS